MGSSVLRIRDRRLPRVVVHLDVDAFFASVEQVLDPALRGRPVIVGSGVVASCSYESRSCGVRTAMRISDAKRLCPEGVFLAGDYGNYALFANRIEGICRDFTPLVEQSALDDFYLDMTGCLGERRQLLSPRGRGQSGVPLAGVHAAGGNLGVGREIQMQVRNETGLSCSIGIGCNKLFAKLASDAVKPGGVREVRPDQQAGWLGRLPVSELPGVGVKMCRELARYNIHTVAELAAVPETVLARLFGAVGRTVWERACGVDERPVRGDGSARHRTPSSISRETTLEQPTSDGTFLCGMLSYLVQRAVWGLRDRRLAARTLGVKLRYSDFESAAASRSLPSASCDDRVFVELARELFAGQYTRRLRIRHLGVELGQLRPSQDDQPHLFDVGGERRRRQLCRVVDQVRSRFGFQSMYEGETTHLIDRLDQDHRGFRLRTPSLSQ